MFKTQNLVYVQMPKTGCTHIALQMSRLLSGEQIGKHNRPSEAELAKIEYFVSSIRNPWDWYLSLWLYGAKGEGLLQKNLLKRDPKSAFLRCDGSLREKISSSIKELTATKLSRSMYYAGGEDVESFRLWLRFMLDSTNRQLIGDGFEKVPPTYDFGFMTQRYIRLCWGDPTILVQDTDDGPNLEEMDKLHCYIDHFIRLENLEEDLCDAIELVRPLSSGEKQQIYSASPTNTSNRTLDITQYYDKESERLVRNRESFLISKFGYTELTN